MISLKVNYKEEDYIPALRTYLLRKPKFIALFTFLYLLTIAFLRVLLGGGAPFELDLFLLYSITTLLCFVGLLFYVLPHQRYRHSFKSVEEHRFHIAEQGIFYETDYANGVLPWRRCTKLLERKHFYLFEHDRRRITVIPKRVFKDRLEENEFREILKSKLPPAFSSKLLKWKEPEPGEGYVPPEKAPDWR
jgi:YcxB-like protein